VRVCPVQAIKLENEKAMIDVKQCQGCGECVPQCRSEAIQPHFGEGMQLRLQEKMAEYMLAIQQEKQGKILYINALFDISPDCDCWGHNKLPIAPNLGFVGSKDPVAVDQASLDLINKAVGRKVFDDLCGFQSDRTLAYAEEIGVGCRTYELVEV
jgi:hypothetical protein